MYYVSKRTGWVIFVDIQYYVLYLCWVGQKKSKNMLTYYRDGPLETLTLTAPSSAALANIGLSGIRNSLVIPP